MSDREQMGGVGKMMMQGGVGKMMMQSRGMFGTFVSIGMDICCRDHLYGT